MRLVRKRAAQQLHDATKLSISNRMLWRKVRAGSIIYERIECFTSPIDGEVWLTLNQWAAKWRNI